MGGRGDAVTRRRIPCCGQRRVSVSLFHRVTFSPRPSLNDLPDLAQRQRLGLLPRDQHGLIGFRVQADQQQARILEQQRQDVALAVIELF